MAIYSANTPGMLALRVKSDDKSEPIETIITETDTDLLEEVKKRVKLLENDKRDLLNKLDKAEKERKSLREKIEELKKENQDKIKLLSQEIDELRKKEQKNEANIDSLSQQIEELTEKIVELKKGLKGKDDFNRLLQKQNQHLKEEQERLESDRDVLYLSQVAYLFEQAICSYVLPKVFEKDKHATIRALLSYLHGDIKLPLDDSSGEPLSEAKKRWDEVSVGLNLPTIREGKGHFQWTYHDASAPDIIRAISLLKENRRTVAHPEHISLKLAKEKLSSPVVKGSMPPWQFELIKKFVHCIQRNITSKSGSEIYNNHFQLD